MRSYGEVKNEVEELYHAGYDCLQLTGTDTQYAPVRHALEFLVGQAESLLRRPVPNITVKQGADGTIWYTEDEIRGMLNALQNDTAADAKMAAAALRWVLGEAEDSCEIS